jgi:hypothetical protein
VRAEGRRREEDLNNKRRIPVRPSLTVSENEGENSEKCGKLIFEF